MFITTPQRDAVLGEVTRRVLDLAADRTALIGIDGIDGAGKTTFADELAARVSGQRPVIRASLDSFHNPREVRYRLGRDSPEGFFRDTYDLEALRQHLLGPLSPGGSGTFRRGVFDVERDEPVDTPWEQAPRHAVLIVDGMFLHRTELLGYWDLSVLLSVAWSSNHHIPNYPRGWPSDPEDPRNRRYSAGQEIYSERCRPREHATIVINNEDLREPFFEVP